MQLSFSIRPFIGLCGLLVCLSACGGGDDAANTHAAPAEGTAGTSTPGATAQVPEFEPCGLVTRGELEGIIGKPVKEPESSATPVANVTYYSCASDDIHINVEAWTSAEDAQSSFEIGTKYPEVEGMGHPAHNTQPVGDLDVLVGQYVLTIDLFTNMDKAAQLEAAKQIAAIAIERLP